jgi:hypothetical protein
MSDDISKSDIRVILSKPSGFNVNVQSPNTLVIDNQNFYYKISDFSTQAISASFAESSSFARNSIRAESAATASFIDNPDQLGGLENIFYVTQQGNDDNNGATIATAFKTIKKAAQAAQNYIENTGTRPFRRCSIQIKTGLYEEEAPIYIPPFTSLLGDDLRTTVVRPTEETKNENLFLMSNGTYAYGLRLEGCEIDDLNDPRTGFFFAFAPGAFITTSPYIQNCTAAHVPADKFYVPLDFEGEPQPNPQVGNGPGGMIVDDSVLDGYSPLKSMIVDAYTQVAFNGIGLCVRGMGYAQMVSFFTNFSHVGVFAFEGGHASLLNSNTTFGDYGLLSSGRRMLVVPDVSDVSDYINAQNASVILSEKENIQRYMIEKLQQSGSFSGSYVSYNEDLCRRDIGFIVDALSTDLLYGGNERSIIAARYYYLYPSQAITTQLQQTLRAIEYVGELVTQYTNTTFESSSIASNLDIMLNIIENGLDVAPPIIYNASSGFTLRNIPQFIGTSATQAQVTSLYEYIDIIKNIIEFGTGSLPEIILYETASSEPEVLAAYDSLINNIEFIQEETIAYISSSWSEFDYDEDKCKRDIGFIVRGLAEDLLYGANSSSIANGVAYYEFPSQATTTQLNQTLDAIDYASRIIEKIVVSDQFIPPDQSLFNAYQLIRTNRNLIQSTGINFVNTVLFAIYNSTIKDSGILIDSIVSDMTAKTPGRTSNFVQSLFKAQDTTEDKIYTLPPVGNFVEGAIAVFKVNDIFRYNQNKCFRDVGFIVDALTTDMIYGGNERSITAATYYYLYPSIAITEQLDETIDAINFAGDLIASLTTTSDQRSSIIENTEIITNIIRNGLSVVPSTIHNIEQKIKLRNVEQFIGISATTTEVEFVSQSINIVKDIIVNGTGSLPELIPYDSFSINANVLAARNSLINNIEFIQEETIAYISSSWSEFDYDEDKCKRDIGFIISGAAEDLIYNANSASIANGVAYYEFPSQATTTQLDQTIDALNYAFKLAEKLILSEEFISPDTSVRDAYTSIRTQRATIQSKTINFINKGLVFDFIRSWEYIKEYILNDPEGRFGSLTLQTKEKVEQLLNIVITTIDSVVVKLEDIYLQEFGSLITSTSHDFSYAGSGVNFLGLPVNQRGIGETNFDIRIFEEDGGRVFYTAGDETGDFFAGSDFIIRQETGTIDGRTFNKALFARVTPLQLALETI